jgi:hypothetical protein
MRTLLAIALVAAFAGSASAEDFDLRGWKLLGKRSSSSAGTTNVALRNYDGNLDELRLVVEGGTVKLDDVIVEHTWVENVRAALDITLGPKRPGVSIDLTDNYDTLENVVLGVASLDGPVVIRVYGRDRRKPEQTASSEDVAFVDAEWTSLGDTRLDGSKAGTVQLDNVRVWPALAFVSLDSDLDVLAVTFHTSTGEWIPYLTMKFRDGARTITVDLPSATAVTSIDFEYTVIGGNETRLEVFGMPKAMRVPTAAPSTDGAAEREVVYADSVKTERVAQSIAEPDDDLAPPKPRAPRLRNADAPTYDPDGWTLIGEDDVDLVDDEIEVRREKSTWSEIKLVVDGDEVTLAAVELELAGRQHKLQREQVEEAYGEGSSRVIAIPGKRRAIEKVRLQYKKHKLDASTRVQIYAR